MNALSGKVSHVNQMRYNSVSFFLRIIICADKLIPPHISIFSIIIIIIFLLILNGSRQNGCASTCWALWLFVANIQWLGI